MSEQYETSTTPITTDQESIQGDAYTIEELKQSLEMLQDLRDSADTIGSRIRQFWKSVVRLLTGYPYYEVLEISPHPQSWLDQMKKHLDAHGELPMSKMLRPYDAYEEKKQPMRNLCRSSVRCVNWWDVIGTLEKDRLETGYGGNFWPNSIY
jgi:hypothetical protein